MINYIYSFIYYLQILNKNKFYFSINIIFSCYQWGLGIGDWGLGIGGLGVGAQTQNPNTQTPKPKPPNQGF